MFLCIILGEKLVMNKINKIAPNSLAYRLVQDDVLTETLALETIAQAKLQKTSFITCLIKQKLVQPLRLAQMLAQDFAMPIFDLNNFDQTQIPNHLINEKLVRQHHVLPLWQIEQQLFVAVTDPTNQTALDEIKFHTGLATQSVLVEEDKLSVLIEKVLAIHHSNKLEDINIEILNESELINTEKSQAVLTNDDDAPVVRYVHKILLDAINKRASDIHFEPYENNYQIRFRIDGILHCGANPPANLTNRMTARLKIMADLDIAERRLPQDGRFKITLMQKQTIDFRVSTCPTVHGEKIVLRILDQNKNTLQIDSLGMTDAQQQLFSRTLTKPHGMILVTGPTGSGKTLTLYTALNILNTAAVNICTVEDPVEIHLHGVNQVNINSKAGLNFANVLRAFLRQDPDIMMVGEMRDLETAEIGIKAAQTGHLVLSTLHTNSAAETLTRLMNIGVAPYNIATAVTLIIAQRLARRLCEHCKTVVKIPTTSLLSEGFSESDLFSLRIYQPVGCKDCTDGYKGREGLFELLPVNENITQLILRGESALTIAAQAQQAGMKSLREIGLEKVKAGITSLAEINRVIK